MDISLLRKPIHRARFTFSFASNLGTCHLLRAEVVVNHSEELSVQDFLDGLPRKNERLIFHTAQSSITYPTSLSIFEP